MLNLMDRYSIIKLKLKEKSNREVAENDSLICELDEAVGRWNMQDKIDMLLTATQKDQAIKEEKARQEGIAEGIAVGRAEGIATGRAEGEREAAKKLLIEGIAPDIISRCTGLSIEEIKSL